MERRSIRLVHRAEAICGAIVAAIALSALALAQWRGVSVDYASFAPHMLAGAGMLGLAAWYRLRSREPNIPLTLIASAVFVLFSNAGAVLNYLLIAPGSTPIDAMLFRADAALGFDWRGFVEGVAAWPSLAWLLGWVYQSSLGQLALVILLLGFTGRQVVLHRFLVTGIVCSCLTLAFWAIWPSFGPAAYVALDPATDSALGRVVDGDMGARLLALASHGAPAIDEKSLIGLIAFPSMHTVMALMAMLYTRRTMAFWPLFGLNLAMFPAILVHGGHHLVDVLAGSALFLAVSFLAARIVPDGQAQAASGGRLIRIASMFPPVLRPNAVPRS